MQRPAEKIGLIGKKLGHSYSPEIHALLGMRYSYELREVAPEQIGAFLENNPYDGFNVTIPYKKDIIPFLCGMSDNARRLGSVNTVLRTENGWWGDNTDYDGFAYMVRRSGYDIRGKKAVVLGAGGVSPTVCAVLTDMGADPVVVISHKENTPDTLSLHPDTRILVNTSPVGMYPNNGVSPVAADAFPALECVLDLIYNPFETVLLADARERGLITECGISMLVAQAKRGAELFTGTALDDSLSDRVTAQMIASRRNLILIGMPGCGKSTIGKAAAHMLGRTFIDLDDEIVKEAGKPIADIFRTDGEEAFRALEHRVIKRVCAGSSLVIATGGGCVTRSENYRPMAQNGALILLRRDIASLPTAGRPLSQKTSPAQLYEQRKPLYEAFADAIVDNPSASKKNTGTHTDAEAVRSAVAKTAEAVLSAFRALPDTLRT